MPARWQAVVLALASLAALGAVAGDDAIDQVAGRIEGPPTAVDWTLSWGETTDETTTVEAHLRVRNPNDLALRLGDAEAWVQAHGRQVTVAAPGPHPLPADGTTDLTLAFQAPTPRLVDLLAAHLVAGERSPVTAGASVAAGVGPLETSLALQGTGAASTDLAPRIGSTLADTDAACPAQSGHPHLSGRADADHGLHLPCLVETSHAWNRTVDGDPALESTLRLRNPNPFPLAVGDRSLELRLHDVAVAQGAVAEDVEVPPEAEADVPVTVAVDEDALARWWPRHVGGECETSPASVALALDVEAPGLPRGGTLAVEAPWSHPVRTSLLC